MKDKKNKILKFLGLVLFVLFILAIIFLVAFFFFAQQSYNPNKQITYGVTFSKKFAQEMKLDWQAAYLAMLDDLKVKYLRLPSYWEEIEPKQNEFYFADLDWQINEAAKRDARVILVVGIRQPRWPECHEPEWIKTLTDKEIWQKNLINIEAVVKRYKDNPAIELWQIENEPFLDFFGKCPHMTKQQLRTEIDLVESLDDRKILITDSGELSTWYPAIRMGDIFGTTLYRRTWNKYFGYFKYWFVPASFYRVKAFLWHQPQEATFIAELQAEPWFPNNPLETPLEEHYRTMDDQILQENAEYANKTNFYRAYFWGVEWWYWLKESQGDSSLWDTARQYFK